MKPRTGGRRRRQREVEKGRPTLCDACLHPRAALADRVYPSRRDGTGARFEGGALDAAEATDRFVDEQGGVGAGVVAEDLALGAEDS